jgi:two-component system, NarL family, sensor histidine kinase UhpB
MNHLTATLQKAQQENNRLTLHSLEIVEEQRQLLVQELHDELGQSVTAIKVMAVMGKKSMQQSVDIYQNIIQVCDHLVGVVRAMMKNLHPVVLTELGLKASLEDLVAHWQARTPDLCFSVECQSCLDAVDAKKAIQIFRIVQEAITNTVRHSQAQTLTIQLALKTPYLVTLMIEDDGVGCQLQKLKGGFGLLGMQARVKSLKGTFNIVTAENQGMKIYIQLPYVSQIEEYDDVA